MTKITKAMKEELMRLVNERVHLNDLKQKLDDKLEHITQLIEKKVAIPETDWLVLEKYNKATLKKEWVIKDEKGNTPSRLVWNSYYKDFRSSSSALTTERGIKAPSYSYIEETDPVVDAEIYFRVCNYYDDLDVYNLKLQELKKAYAKLIETSPTFESLCEVWPEAKEIESRMLLNSRPGLKVADDIINMVKEDVAKRRPTNGN